MEKKAENPSLRKYKVQKLMIDILPLVALIVLFGALVAIVQSKGYRLDMYLRIVFNEGVVLAAVATGAIFIYSLGSFDISLGASTLFSATLGVMTYNATESFPLMILVIFAVGIGCSLLSSVLASVFHIPVFVTTVAMMSVLSAVASQIITVNGGASGGISIPAELVKPLDNVPFKIVVLVVFCAICFFVFDYTKVGRREKFLGGNPICAKLTGIDLNKYAIIAFVITGLGVGVGAFLTLVYTPSVSTTTAGSIGMNILVAIVFGGMPISGGPRSRIYSAVVGGFSYILLNNILKIVIDSNAGYGISQVISAVFFLLVVYVTSLNYRTKVLPR
ncbi:MAG: inner-membrane translocator [Oscillospiraceae bacterium]|nr:inner-membrane translocator [Oscillospiraceae bacterium]